MIYHDRLNAVPVLALLAFVAAGCGAPSEETEPSGEAPVLAEPADSPALVEANAAPPGEEGGGHEADGEGEHGGRERGEHGGEHGETREGRGEHGGEHGGGEGEHGGGGEGEHGGGGEGEHGGGGEGEHGEGGEGEHGGEGHDEEGEESGVYISKGSTWDEVRRGARLVLSFDEASGAFEGRVENTTSGQLCAVRVEVHLATGTELGPTPRTDLPAGESLDVVLSAEGEPFDSWTAHPEMSSCG